MQAYPNYYPSQQMSQPNMYPNYNPAMANPYMAQIGQLQQYQQSLQPQIQQPPQQQTQGLVCKPVADASNVSPNDVPMDGNAAVFPKNDFSEIYVKSWTPNGTIQTTVYKPVQPENQSEGTNIPQMDFNALNEDVRALREDIMARLDAIEKSVAKPSQPRGKKAEVSADE